jgi:hypothetical protein
MRIEYSEDDGLHSMIVRVMDDTAGVRRLPSALRENRYLVFERAEDATVQLSATPGPDDHVTIELSAALIAEIADACDGLLAVDYPVHAYIDLPGGYQLAVCKDEYPTR